jgi:hypothetical protein
MGTSQRDGFIHAWFWKHTIDSLEPFDRGMLPVLSFDEQLEDINILTYDESGIGLIESKNSLHYSEVDDFTRQTNELD